MKRRKFLENASVLAGSGFLFPNIILKPHQANIKRNITDSSELWRKSAGELGVLISQKKVSVKEITSAHIERIKAVNPRVNAVTELLEETALKNAEKSDQVISKSNRLTPLFGIPFSVKENIDLAGHATTEGVIFLKNNIVSADSPHVDLIRKSGAIPLARTNMPDFGLRYHTDNDLFGATINPWNALLTPGGSSGGDAVAVATGMVPIGLGNDYGGSIRWPAQCCGVSGLRPSRGRIPFYTRSMSHGTIAPSLRMMAVQGVLARRITDLRTALEIMSASGYADPSWVPAPFDGKTNRPFRVAVITNPGGLGIDDSVIDGVKRAASILEKFGGIVEEIDSTSFCTFSSINTN
ncbi:MAG: amidase family protein [Ferruginibacter sp.]